MSKALHKEIRRALAEVWFEEHNDIRDAIDREKQIKGWNRAWKMKLIEKRNPQWLDFCEELPR